VSFHFYYFGQSGWLDELDDFYVEASVYEMPVWLTEYGLVTYDETVHRSMNTYIDERFEAALFFSLTGNVGGSSPARIFSEPLVAVVRQWDGIRELDTIAGAVQQEHVNK
jgi:hypothetical protein